VRSSDRRFSIAGRDFGVQPDVRIASRLSSSMGSIIIAFD
jgi:hypothetical protein